jgi:hypothetical protein
MRQRFILLLCLLLLIVVLLLYATAARRVEQTPTALFQQYVLKPIPLSVADIRVDQPRSFQGYTYVFRFRISKADLSLILGSRPLECAPGMRVGPGGRHLTWQWGPRDSHSGGGLLWSPYGDGPGAPGPPSWYWDLRHWVNFEAYALEYMKKRPGMTSAKIMEVLIYSEALGEAYFFTESINQRW